MSISGFLSQLWDQGKQSNHQTLCMGYAWFSHDEKDKFLVSQLHVSWEAKMLYVLHNILKTNQSSVPKRWCATKSAGKSRFVACLLDFPEHLGNKGHCSGWAPFPLSTLSQTSPLFRQRASRKTGGTALALLQTYTPFPKAIGSIHPF